ncbi:MAG: hypothetical protein WC887_00875 [Candidatus Paceibacterota bacterium]|jgi:hypothetical protein
MSIFSSNSFLKHIQYGTYINPVRDWLVMLTFSAITLIGIIVWNVWTFDTVVNGGVIGTVATSTSPIFNQASLDTIHTIFENRAAEKTKYINGTYRFSDPSQ